jgi:hypothetical protein
MNSISISKDAAQRELIFQATNDFINGRDAVPFGQPLVTLLAPLDRVNISQTKEFIRE